MIAAWQRQEGDITYLTDKFLFPEDPDDPFFTLPANGQRSKRAAVKDRYRLWQNGVIPYVLSTNYSGLSIVILTLKYTYTLNRLLGTVQSSILNTYFHGHLQINLFPAESQRNTVLRAMDHWENHTCIRFVPHTGERDFIEIFPGRG